MRQTVPFSVGGNVVGGRDLRLRIDQIRLCTFSKLEFSSHFTVPVLFYLQSYPGILQVIKCMYKDRGFLHVCVYMHVHMYRHMRVYTPCAYTCAYRDQGLTAEDIKCLKVLS